MRSLNSTHPKIIISKPSVAGNPSGMPTYTNAAPMPVTIGGLSAGTTFSAVPISQVLTQLLYPYQQPAFTSFSMLGQSSALEVGNSISSTVKFSWDTTHQDNITANSLVIQDVTTNGIIASGLAKSGTYTANIASITNNSATSHTFKIYGTNTLNATFASTYTVAWEYRLFYGESASKILNAAGIAALRVSSLMTGFSGSYAYNAGGYKVLVYPTLWGTISKAIDSNTKLDVPIDLPYTVNVTNAYGVSVQYNVVTTTNTLGGSINITYS